MPKPKLQPVSRASSATTSSRRLSRMSAALRKIPWRTAGGVCAHAGNAAAAASIARLRVGAGPGGDARDDVAGERIEVVERAAVAARPTRRR